MAAQYGIDLVVRALGGPAISQVAGELKKVETAAKAAQGSIDGAANNIRSFGAASQAATGAVGGLGTAVSAALGPLLSVAAALAAVKQALDVAFERGAAEQKLKNFTDSTAEYEAAVAVAAQAAQRFGLSQTEASTALADVYGRLKGLGFGLKETSEIYMGFNSIAKASGTTAEDASGAFLQLSQALGSGKLQGDELRAILERMPQLAQAIAQSMGVSAAEIRQMGQEGKITSDVIYKALSEAATASGDFSNKLTDQQKAMASLKQVADQLLNSLGQVFAPFVIKGAEMLATIGQTLADWWGYIGNVVFPKVQQALEPLTTALRNAFADIDFQPFVAFLQNVLIKGFEAAIIVISNVSKVLGWVVTKFKELSQSSVVQGLLGAIGKVVDMLGLGGSKVQEWKGKQEQLNDSAAKSVTEFSKLPPKIDDAKKAAKELKKEQEAVTKAIQDATAAADQQAQVQTSAVDGMLQVTQARLQAEMAVNQVLLDQAQRQLQAATSQEQRVRAAQQIYQITVRNAQLELQATQAQIQAELEKSRIAVESARLKEREIYAIVQLAIAQKSVTAAHFEALNAQRQAVGQAEKLYQVAKQVAEAQNRAAEATYRGKVAAADAAYQVNVAAKNTQAAAGAASQYANEMTRAAGAAQQAASAAQAMGPQGAGVRNGVAAFGEAGSNRAFMGRFYEAMNQYNQKEGMRDSGGKKYWEIFNSFLKEAEAYNRGKAREANNSAREDWRKYTGGGPGNRNTSINITTGPVMQMGNKNYIEQGDFASGLKQAAQQGADMALGKLQSDPQTRRRVGLA